MVESSTLNDPLNLRANEKHFGTQLMTYWNNRERYPVLKQAENGNLLIRQIEEPGNLVTMLVEYNNIPGLTPDDFLPFMNQWDVFTRKFNPYCIGFDSIEAGDYKSYKITSRAPWPVAGRLMFATVYPMPNYAKDEHIMIVTDKGLEAVFDKYLTVDDRKNLVVARFHFGGWWFTPVKDTNGKITGTCIFGAFCSDVGGSVPKWLQKAAAPAAAI
jgi:hypothetical protein